MAVLGQVTISQSLHGLSVMFLILHVDCRWERLSELAAGLAEPQAPYLRQAYSPRPEVWMARTAFLILCKIAWSPSRT